MEKELRAEEDADRLAKWQSKEVLLLAALVGGVDRQGCDLTSKPSELDTHVALSQVNKNRSLHGRGTDCTRLISPHRTAKRLRRRLCPYPGSPPSV